MISPNQFAHTECTPLRLESFTQHSVFVIRHVVVWISSLFVFIAELYCILKMYHSLFIYSSVDEHLGCFLKLRIKLLCTFLYLSFGENDVLVPLGSISRIEIAKS